MDSFGQLTEEDRSRAVEVLNNRLTPGDLREVLDKEKKNNRTATVESIVLEAERRPTRGRPRTHLPDEELAQFLVDLRGISLLEGKDAGRELRFRLARRASDDELDQLHGYEHGQKSRRGRKAQAEAVARRPWHSGKSWPRYFVRTLGLPLAFSGLPGSEKEPENLEVAPFVPLSPLEAFQEELRKQALDVLSSPAGTNRGILSLPTGAGKTRTAVESLVSWKLSQKDCPIILWIAQSEELCEQAVQSFREVWIDLGHRPERIRSNLTIARFWGSSSVPAPEETDVIVASIQKLHATVRDETSENRSALTSVGEQLGVVVVDEAHRIDAPSYSDVLGFLGVDISPSSRSTVPLLGLTATPYRSDDEGSRRLARMFHGRLLRSEPLGNDPISTLRSRGVLSNAEHELLRHDAPEFVMDRNRKFVEHFEQFNEFHSGFLQEIGESEKRNRALFERIKQIPENSPTLFFGCTVEHAEAMSVLLRRAGRTAEVITGQTRSATRRALIEEFRAGNISVLCNYGVLTTGFDAPRVETVVIGRPTLSRVLYEQMIGRGMRGPRFGGTRTCTVIDVQDNIRFRGELAYNRYAQYWSRERG